MHWLLAAAVALALVFAVALRVHTLATQITHVDDIGVAVTILEARREVTSAADLRRIVNNPQLRQFSSSKFRLLRRIDRAGLLAPAFGVLGIVRDVLAVPARWTYGPGQYLVTPLLLSEGAGYRTSLARGRLPSSLVSIVAMLAAGWLAWRLERSGAGLAAAGTIAVLALSLELLNLSSHMSPYAASTLATVALAALAMRSPGVRWIRWGLCAGVTLWLLVLLSYQVLPLVVATFAVWGIFLLRDHRSAGNAWRALLARREARALATAGIVFAVLMLPTYVVLLSSVRPITWNAGDHGEFLAASYRGGTAKLWFLLLRGWQTFSAMVTPVPWPSAARVPVSGALLLLAGLGAAALTRGTDRQRRVALFAAIAIAIQLATAMAGLTALSPTRHALILLPLFAVAIGFGLQDLAARFAGRHAATAVFAIIAVAVATVAPIAWASANARRDPFDEAAMVRTVDRLRPDAVIAHAFTDNLDLMPRVLARTPVYNADNLSFPWRSSLRPVVLRRVLLVSGLPPQLPEVRAALDGAARSVGREPGSCAVRPIERPVPAQWGETYPILPAGGRYLLLADCREAVRHAASAGSHG